jgi:chromosome segregation ATPase
VKTLFDDHIPERLPEAGAQLPPDAAGETKEGAPLDRLKNLEEKIAGAIGKVKALKEENAALSGKIRELEALLRTKEDEIGRLSSEKVLVKNQVEELLSELDALNLD